MIEYTDTEFHPRDPADRTWTETTVLIISIPEEQIFGNAYILARPNLGVTLSSIILAQGFCRQPYEVDFTDPQMHLPCPESFSNYSLENGLTVSSDGPRNYQMKYKNALGAASFDLTFEGLHDPFDPHDPAMNPLLEADRKVADIRKGDEWENGHFEVKGRIRGELELRGKRYRVDSYEGMDHSWGPRTEIGTRSVSWVSVNFGDDFAMHMAVPMTVTDGQVRYDKIRFGYVVENGQVYGLVDGTVEAERVDMLAFSNRLTATDVRGRTYEFFGTAIAGHPWYTFNPSHVCYQSLFRYQQGDSVGYGEMGDIFGLDYLAERLSRHGREKAGRTQ